jgi:hypothetical protein
MPPTGPPRVSPPVAILTRWSREQIHSTTAGTRSGRKPNRCKGLAGATSGDAQASPLRRRPPGPLGAANAFHNRIRAVARLAPHNPQPHGARRRPPGMPAALHASGVAHHARGIWHTHAWCASGVVCGVPQAGAPVFRPLAEKEAGGPGLRLPGARSLAYPPHVFGRKNLVPQSVP